VEVTAPIQEDLARHDLLPEDQVVDAGYVDADLLESLQEQYGIRLLGPVLSDNSWQAKAGKGFDLAHFQLDWQNEVATCSASPDQFSLESGRRADGNRLC